jgi:hypothetical protein
VQPPPPPDACVALRPCGPNAECAPLSAPNKAGNQYVCTCLDGFRGDPYDSGPQKCRDQEQLYLEELFGMNKCYGCRCVCVCVCMCMCNCVCVCVCVRG